MYKIQSKHIYYAFLWTTEKDINDLSRYKLTEKSLKNKINCLSF